MTEQQRTARTWLPKGCLAEGYRHLYPDRPARYRRGLKDALWNVSTDDKEYKMNGKRKENASGNESEERAQDDSHLSGRAAPGG